MIVDLPQTTVADISRRLIGLRQDVGTMALGRVLTLVVVVEEARAEEALDVATDATHQHPSRIVCVVLSNPRGATRLDGQIRVGGDAGASEIIVLRLFGELTKHGEAVVLPLLLPDSPVVVWWPYDAPKDPAADPIGALGRRRITDAQHSGEPSKTLRQRAKTYASGDTDLVWTRCTKWRGLLAAALDQPPFEPVQQVVVTGGLDSASTDLLAAWLGECLDAPVWRARTPAGSGLVSVRLQRASGPVDVVRPPDGVDALLEAAGQPPRRLALPRRDDAECLSDELARLDADEVYEASLLHGLTRLTAKRSLPAGDAVDKGIAPSVDHAREMTAELHRAQQGLAEAAMVERPEPPAGVSDQALQRAVQTKLEALPSDTGEPQAASTASRSRTTAQTDGKAKRKGGATGKSAASKKADKTPAPTSASKRATAKS